MVVLKAFEPPRELEHQEDNTQVFVEGGSLGNGTLYIGHRLLAWLNQNGEGFTLEYPAISLHAVCKDTASFPHQCLYVMLDAALAPEFSATNGANEDEDEDEGVDESDSVREVRFVPSSPDKLESMYRAMSECQKLHPDPEDEQSDEEYNVNEDAYYETVDDATLNGGQFFTDASGLEQLNAEGRANLARMMNMMEIGGEDVNEDDEPVPGGGRVNGAGGDHTEPNQFDDADPMDQ